MAAAAAAQERPLVTRHVLCVISEGLPRMAVLGAGDVSFGPGCLALRCQDSEMTAGVDVERHQTDPGTPTSPWQVVAEGPWQLTSGHLAVTNIEGLLEWLPGLGLGPGTWNTRVSTFGGQQAADLEDRLLDDDEAVEEPSDGPERWLVQLWP